MFRRKKQKRLLQASEDRLEELRDAVEPLYYPAFRLKGCRWKATFRLANWLLGKFL